VLPRSPEAAPVARSFLLSPLSMSTMPVLTFLLALLAADPVSRIEADGLRVETSVSSQVYVWRISNLGSAPPIESIEITVPLTYDLTVPDGWQYDYRESVFRAWTDRLEYAIQPGRTLQFHGRATSAGGPIARTAMSLGTLENPRATVLHGVYAPGPRSRSLVWVIALTVAAVGLLHAALVTRQRRTSSSRGK